MTSRDTKRILFAAEDVMTAQVSRLMRLAESLPSDRFEVHFATAEFSATVFADTNFRRHRVHSLPREQMLASVAAGKQVYDPAVLSRLPSGDLCDVMTWGDLVLYPHAPELAPTQGAPSTQHYLGPVLSSAPVELRV